MFQPSLKNIWNIFLDLSAGQIHQNCRGTLVIPPRTSVATIFTFWCNHHDGEYFLHRITRKLGSTMTSTVITRLLPLTDYISGAENETLRALLRHTNGNIEGRSPSAVAMMMMVAAATIMRFPPVNITWPGQLQQVKLLCGGKFELGVCKTRQKSGSKSVVSTATCKIWCQDTYKLVEWTKDVLQPVKSPYSC